MSNKSDDEIMGHFVLNVMLGDEQDSEINRLCAVMDSIDNLNGNPMAIRTAGLQGMRRAFLLGVRYAESINKEKGTQ
jgi:hypothetical protein